MINRLRDSRSFYILLSILLAVLVWLYIRDVENPTQDGTYYGIEIQVSGERVLEERGCDYAVRAELTETWFPSKEYEDFALPAGEYTALRVVIGEGAGQNWWCVAFPPLCLGAASETVEEAAQAGRFTDDQAALMTGETQGYVLKFKAIELWEGLKRLTGG